MNTYIHQHSEWPTFTWDAARLSPLLADIRHRQGLLCGRMASLGFRVRMEASLTSLTSDVVKSSAIEGERLNATEVRSSLARKLGLDHPEAPLPETNVEGIVAMMLDATQHYAAPLTAARLFRWHTSLFADDPHATRTLTIGDWRPASAGAMQVVSGPVGRERIHFEAPAADRLDAEMTTFFQWFENETRLDPVLKAGLAHLWFVTIHPFEDGNGRIARALADMALSRSEGMSERFYSMSAQIEAERKHYYLQLERAQRSGSLDVTPWIEWFLQCLGRAIESAEQITRATLQKARLWEDLRETVNDRQRLVLNRLADGFTGKLTTSKYARLAKCSTDTALRDIKELVARHILVQAPGGGRSTSYALTVDQSSSR